MPKLRFHNQQLQERLIADLAANDVPHDLNADGSVSCSEQEWNGVNSIAHLIRDSCFRWYFSWSEDEDYVEVFSAHLQRENLRYELEHHEDRTIFLLPKDDQDKHVILQKTPSIDSCSFCNKGWLEIDTFYATQTAAICGTCLESMYEMHRTEKDQ